MSTSPGGYSPLRRPRRSLSLTNVITVLALIFGMAFGICAVSGLSLSRGGDPHSAHLLIATAVVMGAVCVACLLAVAAFAVIRSRFGNR